MFYKTFCYNNIRKYISIFVKMSKRSNVWIDALREFNKGNSNWCVPRKNTAEYNTVKDISNRLSKRRKKESAPPFNIIMKEIKKEREEMDKESSARKSRLRKLDEEFQFP